MNETLPKDATEGEASADWFLRMLVDMTNDCDLAIPITFSVHGTVVTGELASGKKYFQGFGEDIIRATGQVTQESKEFLRKAFGSPARIYEEETNKGRRPTQYAHLKNAKIVHPGAKAMPDNQEGDGWLRIRLDSVDAFFLGRLSSS